MRVGKTLPFCGICVSYSFFTFFVSGLILLLPLENVNNPALQKSMDGMKYFQLLTGQMPRAHPMPFGASHLPFGASGKL